MDLKELMKKKGKEKLDPSYKDAKMGVLKEIMDMASGEMKGDLAGAQKVTVAADDKEGLKDGLEKAKDLVGKMPVDDKEHEDSESPEKEAAEEEGAEEAKEEEGSESKLSPEEMDVLKKLLAKMK